MEPFSISTVLLLSKVVRVSIFAMFDGRSQSVGSPAISAVLSPATRGEADLLHT
jgi:hypothetical protein